MSNPTFDAIVHKMECGCAPTLKFSSVPLVVALHGTDIRFYAMQFSEHIYVLLGHPVTM